MSFSSLGLSEVLVNAVSAAGYQQPTPVQQQAIPAVLQGRDLMVAAQTGTGKTGGFALPTLELLFPQGNTTAQNDRQPRQPKVLVLTPTRELATQVHESFQLYAQGLPLSSACVFGGVGIKPQIQALSAGLDVLVACPGRLLDLTVQQAVDLSGVKILVLDEADRMLDMGFIHDVKKVLAKLPSERQNLLFSATFSDDIVQLAKRLLHDPQRIEVTPPNTTVERIDQRIYRVEPQLKRALLAHLIKAGNWEQVLVFTRTKHGANRLAEYLNKQDLSSAAIHGNKSQNARTHALAQFKNNEIRILVATDIAARGLDIDQLPHVVNFELPNVAEDYVHRIGRTGRAGRAGQAISLVTPGEEKLLKAIERLTHQQIPEGDTQGFEPPEQSAANEEPQAQPKAPRSGRRSQSMGNGKAATAGQAGTDTAKSGSGRRRNRRKAKTGETQPQAAAVANYGNGPLPLPPERDPEEFLDDEYDNFGNRADYVSPAQRNARAGAKKRQGSKNGNGRAKNAGNGNRRSTAHASGQGNRKQRTDQQVSYRSPEPAPQPKPIRQPLIVRKGERLPSLEELRSLDQQQQQQRPRRERPALLTRNDI